MKKTLIKFSLLMFLFSGQASFAACTDLCDENWWNKTTLSDLKSYLSDESTINLKDPYGFSPLHFAVSSNSSEKVELLLTLGANVDAKSHYGFTPIYHAVGKSGDLKIVLLLLESGAKVNLKNRDGITPLHYAAWGTSEKIESLLNAGADPVAKSKSGRTPYDMALENEDLVGTDVLEALKDAATN